jgi:hypothetical protein
MEEKKELRGEGESAEERGDGGGGFRYYILDS